MGRMVTVEEWAEIHGRKPAAVRRMIHNNVWPKARNVLVDGKLTWLLDEDWLWPKATTPAKQASLLCEIRKLMPPVVYATSANGVVVCMVPCTGYTRTAVNVTAEEMNELWSVKPQQRAAAQGALTDLADRGLHFGFFHSFVIPSLLKAPLGAYPILCGRGK